MTYYEKMQQSVIKKDAIILGIESSCDETAAAIVKGGRVVLSEVIISSAEEHKKYGGVVPEIASRAHTGAVSNAVMGAIEKAGITLKEIDGVAVTYGAGLLGALLVGLSYAKALAFSLNVPLIPVSHIRGHMSAGYLADLTLEPPFISVLASGGHTAIGVCHDYFNYEILGSTLDDAVGEAFDKVARVLGLSYPGGPSIEKLSKNGNDTVPMPKMLKNDGGYNFSYSGLKTAVINYVHNKEQKGEQYSKEDVAYSFQKAAIDVIVDKAIKASIEKDIKTIVVGGGVGANAYLRDEFTKKCGYKSIKLVLPPKSMCTDNASMIASEGYRQYLNRNFADLDLNARASVPLK